MSEDGDKSNSKYLSLSDDFDQLRYGLDGKEKAIGGLKLLGKGFFNIAKFTVTEGLPKMAEIAEKERKKRER